jgi:hypothetical protein
VPSRAGTGYRLSKKAPKKLNKIPRRGTSLREIQLRGKPT